MAETPRSIVFRVDSGMQIGSGHLMRCLSLAGEVRRRGHAAAFVCRDLPGHMTGSVRREGFPVTLLASELAPADDARATCAAVSVHGASWVVVDHYGLDAVWERIVAAASSRILAIDDLANRDHACDLLLDQNYSGGGAQQGDRYRGLVPPFCRTLLGPRYALLRPEYRVLHAALPRRAGEVRRVLVFFGASDASDETSKALRALSEPDLAGIALDVVVGANHPAPERVAALAAARGAAAVHRDLPSLAGLMMRADLAVGAGGTTTWERLCLRLPAVVVTIAENQEHSIACLARDGAVRWAGRSNEVSVQSLAAAIRAALMDDREAPPLVDGFGLVRVVAALLPPEGAQLQLRRAQPGDAILLFDWRNEPLARAMSVSREPIGWRAHVDWLTRKLSDTATEICIAEIDGVPVGQVRIDACDGEAVISYAVDADHRGRGVGAALVREALRRRPEGELFRAHVKAANAASLRIFQRLGWHETIMGAEHVFRSGRCAAQNLFEKGRK